MSQVIRFRLEDDYVARLTATPDSPSASLAAKAVVVAHLNGLMAPMTLGVEAPIVGQPEVAPDEAPQIDTVSTNASEKPEAPPENHFARQARLRAEWKQLCIDHPALAREVGSYEEYEVRQT